MKLQWFFGMLAFANWVKAQCGYTGNGCPGITPAFLMGPPSPQCSNALPLTVTFFSTASGGGISSVSYYVRSNSGGAWNVISNPSNNKHTFTAAGIYQVLQIITGPGGCRDSLIQCYTISQPPAPTFVMNPVSPQCERDLPITLNLNNTTPIGTGQTYAWYVNGNLIATTYNANHTLTAPGNYTIKLVTTDSVGCRDSLSQMYVVYSKPTAGFTVNIANPCRGRRVCFNNTTTGTGPGTTYYWDFGDGNTSTKVNPCHNFNNPGTYNVMLIARNGGICPDTTYAVVNVLPGGLADILGDGFQDTVKYCVFPGDPTTNYTVTFTSNTSCPGGGCTYTWDFGDGTPTIVTNADTPQVHTYTSFGEWWAFLTVTHPGGCVHKDSIYVVFQPIQVTAVFDIPAPDYSGCAPHTVHIQNISHTNAVKFIWDYGDGQGDTVSPPSTVPFTHTYTSAGTYQIKLTALNACGSTFTIKGPIIVVGKPKINSVNINPNPGCAPQTINFSINATGVQPPNNYHWYFGPPGAEAHNVSSTSYTYMQAGGYNFMVIARNGCGDDTFKTNIFIDTLAKPLIQAFPTEGCHALTVNFLNNTNVGVYSSTPFEEELWINNGLACGPWWCGVNCPNYANYTPNLGCGCCAGTTTTLPGQPMIIPPITFTNPSGNAVLTYNVLYKIKNRCGNPDTLIPIKVHPPVKAFFTATPKIACVGTAITLQNTSWGDSLTFIWDMGDGSPYFYDTAMAAASQMPRSHTYTYTTPGTYVITLYVQGYCGPDTLRDTVTIHPYPTAAFSVDATEKCQGSGAFIFTNSSDAGAIYNWSFPGGTPSSSTAYNPPPVIFNTPGPQTITLTVTQNGCTSTASQTVNVSPLPTVSFSVSPSTGCPPLSVSITQSSPNLPGYTYIWDYGNGTRDTNYTPTSPIVYNNLSTTTAQTYLIKLIIITDKGCIDSLQQAITVYPKVVAGFTAPALVCEGVAVSFTNTSNGADTYQWDFGDGSPIGTGANPTHTYASGGLFNVQMIAINGNTGCRDTFTQTIHVNPIPNPTFTIAPTGGCVPLTVSLTNTTPFDPTHMYIWDYGNGQRDTSYTPNNPTYSTAGSYVISLEVVTPAGCRRTTPVTVTASALPTANFAAPTSECVSTPIAFTNASTGATTYHWDFGDLAGTSTTPNPTYTYTNPGTYVVVLVAISGSGCQDTFRQNITIHPQPVADFTYTIECLGNPTSFTDNSIGAISYQWDFGDGSPVITSPNPTHTYATAGTYSVQLIVTNSNGCKDTIIKNVPVNTIPASDFSFSSACLGQSTVFTDMTPGTPIAWKWDFGDGSPPSNVQNPTHTYAFQGTYLVKLVVWAGTGCVDSITKPVTVYLVPTAGFTSTTACAQDEAVAFTNTSVNATSYEWHFGDGSPASTSSNPTHVYSSGGSYVVQLIASNGPTCRDTFTQTVTVYPKPTVSFSSSTVCLGQATNFTASSNLPIPTYQWDFGDGSPLGSGPTVTHTYGAAGTYLVTLIGQTTDGCKDTFQMAVQISPQPTASFTTNTPCLGQAVVFTNTSTGAVSWQWNFGDGVGTSTAPNPSYVYGAPGTYSVSLTVTSSSGCSHTITQTVTVWPKPQANFVADTACHASPTHFTDQSVNATSWSWDFGDGHSSSLQNPTHTYAAPGTYTVTLVVTNSHGCTDTLPKTIVVHPHPTANFTYDTACAHRPTVFTDQSQGGVVFWSWNFGDNTPTSPFQNPTHIYTQGGVYQVTLIVGNNFGCIDQIILPVAVYTMPEVNFVADTVCVGRPTHFTNLTRDSVNVSYVWLFGDGNASFVTNPTYIYQAPGTYQVTLTATNAYGCDTFLTKFVVVAPVPQADFIADTACAGHVTTFTDATQGLVDTWIWNFGDGTRDTVHTPTIQHTYPGPGSYVVTMTAVIGGCSNAVTKGVFIMDSLQADILLSEAVICPGESITAIDGSAGGVSWWLWDMGDGTTASGPVVANHVYSDSGLYTIQLIVGNGHCVDTAVAQVYVIGRPQALFNVSDVCEGFPVSFSNVSFPGALPVQWLWDFGNGDTSHAMMPVYAYSAPGTYPITLIMHNGRCGDTLRRSITVWPKPQATILVQDSITRILKETYFSDMTPGSVIQRHWSLGDGATSTAAQLTYMYRDTGAYWVELVVIDDHGCVDTAYQRIMVYGDFRMFVPTAFSPNGDGVNDVFYPGGLWFDFDEFLLQIYDRWGYLIWETRTPKQAWDGHDQRTGDLVPEDAYVFRVRGKDFKGKYHEYVGTVTVLK